ncbi:MAG: bifunctional ADP-heptose synthase [Chloroflexota bacterium]
MLTEHSERLLAALARLVPHRILVVGDLALDEYLVGTATRLSREAPIPVLEYTHEFTVPGGAGNPAHNLGALGAHAIPIGVIGQDKSGERLLTKFRELRIDLSGIVTDPSRPTTTKTRIMAAGAMPTFPQQVARLDRIERRPLSDAMERALSERIAQCAEQADALIVSDYGSGLVTPNVIAACLRVAKARHLLLTVDSQGDLLRFGDFDLVRANRQETEATLGRALSTEDDFKAACDELLQRLNARVVVITRADEGLSIATRDGTYAHVPAVNRSEVFDVTGAGDTVIAVLTLALACGVDPFDAAQLAAVAAGIVVKHIGVAVATIDELRKVIGGE